MVRVLLALDESEAAHVAARTASRLFGASAVYLAVNVAERSPVGIDPPIAWGGVYPYAPPYPLLADDLTGASAEAREQAAGEARDAALAAARAAGVAAVPVGEVGDPVAAILDAADEHDVDVIVVGSSDKGWWRRLIEGSVSQELVREARRPVLVVHPPVDEKADEARTSP